MSSSALRPLPGLCLALCLLLAGAARCQADGQIDYVVQPGDNPWNLTERYLKGLPYWPRLQAFNHIHDAQHIPPGTVLHIPIDWLQLSSTRIDVVGLYGDVRLFEQGHDGSDAGTPLQAGASLKAGGRLVTAAGASVALQFADGSRVLLLPDSEMRIQRADSLAAGGGVILRLQLLKGNLENHVQPRKAPGSRFEIETPAAVAAVRGTDFRVGADEGRTRTEVLGGVVSFGNAQGGLDVPTGFGTAAAAGAAPLPPRPLLPAPDASAAPALIERLPLDAPIGAVGDAQAYRTLVAADADFTAVLSSETSPAPRLRAADLPDGHFRYRVRAIDAQGLEGYAAEGEMTVHARPEPPLLLGPPAGATLVDARPELRWTARAGDYSYRVQLASDRAFTQPAADLTGTQGDHVRPDQDLPLGSWWWRVATVSPKDGQGPFGDPAMLRRVPPGPDVQPPRLHDGDLQFAWSDAGAGMRYHLEVAQDAGFDKVLLRQELEQPSLTWHPPAPGRYWLRVATEASGDLLGPWGPPQSVDVPQPPVRWPWLLLLIPVLIAP